MGTAPGGSTLPGGSTWGPAAGSRQKNIQARGRAGCLRHTSARTVLEGCPTGAAALRGWGRPGRAFNLNLREASRRRAAPGRAGIWAPAAPPVVQSRRRRQLLRPGATAASSRVGARGSGAKPTQRMSLAGAACSFFLISLMGTFGELAPGLARTRRRGEQHDRRPVDWSS